MTTKKTTNLVQIIAMMENEWQLSEDEIEEDLLDEECSLPTDYLQKAQEENNLDGSIVVPNGYTLDILSPIQ